MSRQERADSRRREIEAQQRERESKERHQLRDAIRARLAEVPASWRQQYRRLLRQHGVDPSSSIAHLSLEPLKARRQLLPPATSYLHMRNPNHPSFVEERAVWAEVKRQATRSENKQTCGNKRAVSPSLYYFPDKPNIARIAPHNLVTLGFADGHTECVNVRWLKTLLKNGQTVAPSYQRDAYGDHWAEMRVDTEGRGPVRVPLWLLEKATGTRWAPTKQRLQPPHETRYK